MGSLRDGRSSGRPWVAVAGNASEVGQTGLNSGTTAATDAAASSARSTRAGDETHREPSVTGQAVREMPHQHRPLQDLVLKGRYPDRAGLAPVSFRNLHPSHWWRKIRSRLEALEKTAEVVRAPRKTRFRAVAGLTRTGLDPQDLFGRLPKRLISCHLFLLPRALLGARHVPQC